MECSLVVVGHVHVPGRHGNADLLATKLCVVGEGVEVGGFVDAFVIINVEIVIVVIIVVAFATRLRRVERNDFHSQNVASAFVRAFLGLPGVAFWHFQAERPFAPIRAVFLGSGEEYETVVEVHVAILGELKDECWQVVAGGEILANRIEDEVVVDKDEVVQVGRLNLHFDFGSWTNYEGCRSGGSEVAKLERTDAVVACLQCAVEVHRTTNVARSAEDAFREHVCHHVGRVMHGSCASRESGTFGFGSIVVDEHASFLHADGSRDAVVVARDAISACTFFDDTHSLSRVRCAVVVNRSDAACQGGIGVECAHHEVGLMGVGLVVAQKATAFLQLQFAYAETTSARLGSESCSIVDDQALVGKERIGLFGVGFVGTEHLALVWQNESVEASICHHLIIRINVSLSREKRPVGPSAVLVGRDECALSAAVDVQCTCASKWCSDVGVASCAHVERLACRDVSRSAIGVVVARCVCPSEVNESTFHRGEIVIDAHQLDVVEIVINVVGVDAKVEQGRVVGGGWSRKLILALLPYAFVALMRPTIIFVECFRTQEDGHVLVVAFVGIGTLHTEADFGVFLPDAGGGDAQRKRELGIGVPFLHHEVQHFVVGISWVGHDGTFHRRCAAIEIPKAHLVANGIVLEVAHDLWRCKQRLCDEYCTN